VAPGGRDDRPAVTGRDREELGMEHVDAAPAAWVDDEPQAEVQELETREPETQEPETQEPETQEPAPEYPDPPRTGDPAVDRVLDAVAGAVSGPLEEQLSAYDAAHRTLQDRLADVEG
jgi:hypothetical protein